VYDQTTRFWSNVDGAFQAALAAAGGPVDRCFCVGGQVFRLRFAGQALTGAVVPALAHLACDPTDSPDMSVGLWDQQSTGVPFPALSPHLPADGQTLEVGQYHFGPTRRLCQELTHTCAFDAASRKGYFWTQRPLDLPPWEIAQPLRPLLHWWQSTVGGILAHAAAIGQPDAGLLLAGRGGSGKSTTALACMAAGVGYAGDDFVLLRDDSGPMIHSLFRSAKLDPLRIEGVLPGARQYLAKVPASHAATTGAPSATCEMRVLDHQKAVVLVPPDGPWRMCLRMPLTAILLPRVAGGRTRMRPARPAEVLRALAPSSLLQLPGSSAAHLRMMANLVERVPGFHLDLGPDLDDVVDCVGRLLPQHIIRFPNAPPMAERRAA
jgi:hypothetical protein